MTGYLARLIERMTPGAPRIRPRPVSLFEPAAPVELAWAATPEPDTGDGDAPVPRESARPPAGERARPEPAGQARRQRPGPAGESRPPATAARPARSPVMGEIGEASGRPAQLGYLLPRPAPPIDRSPGAPGERAVPTPNPVTSAPREAVETRAPEVRPTGEAPPVAPAVASPRPAAPVTTARPNRPEPARARRPVEGRQSRPVKGEPAIQVTIGRVEVIAAPPAHPAPQPAVPVRPSGVMSLDEYLKRREQEGRT